MTEISKKGIHIIFAACNVYIFYSLSLSASSTTKMAPGGGHPRPIKRSYCVPCTIARVNHKTEKSGRKGEKTLHITANQTLDHALMPTHVFLSILQKKSLI